MYRPPGYTAAVNRIAVFVSPHGFGHATRTCALLEALARRVPNLHCDLFTTVPEWLFEDSLRVPFTRRPVACDVGLVQRDALHEDPVATCEALESFVAAAPAMIDQLAREVEEAGCRAVLCDIAPLGLAVAARLGLASALVENFVWSFIYSHYTAEAPGLAPLVDRFREWEELATVRLSVQPTCGPRSSPIVGPVQRPSRQGRERTRQQLELDSDEVALLWTMGGIPWQFDLGSGDGQRLPAGVTLIVPGAAERYVRAPGLRLLPRRSHFYHPDLVAAADGVIGKLGYGTVAEAWAAGTPLAFVPRRRFPESPFLAEFAERELRGFALPVDGDLDLAEVEAIAGQLVQRGRATVEQPQRGTEEGAQHLVEGLGLGQVETEEATSVH